MNTKKPKRRSTFVAIERKTIRDYASSWNHISRALRFWEDGKHVVHLENRLDQAS